MKIKIINLFPILFLLLTVNTALGYEKNASYLGKINDVNKEIVTIINKRIVKNNSAEKKDYFIYIDFENNKVNEYDYIPSTPTARTSVQDLPGVIKLMDQNGGGTSYQFSELKTQLDNINTLFNTNAYLVVVNYYKLFTEKDFTEYNSTQILKDAKKEIYNKSYNALEKIAQANLQTYKSSISFSNELTFIFHVSLFIEDPNKIIDANSSPPLNSVHWISYKLNTNNAFAKRVVTKFSSSFFQSAAELKPTYSYLYSKISFLEALFVNNRFPKNGSALVALYIDEIHNTLISAQQSLGILNCTNITCLDAIMNSKLQLNTASEVWLCQRPEFFRDLSYDERIKIIEIYLAHSDLDGIQKYALAYTLTEANLPDKTLIYNWLNTNKKNKDVLVKLLSNPATNIETRRSSAHYIFLNDFTKSTVNMYEKGISNSKVEYIKSGKFYSNNPDADPCYQTFRTYIYKTEYLASGQIKFTPGYAEGVCCQLACNPQEHYFDDQSFELKPSDIVVIKDCDIHSTAKSDEKQIAYSALQLYYQAKYDGKGTHTVDLLIQLAGSAAMVYSGAGLIISGPSWVARAFGVLDVISGAGSLVLNKNSGVGKKISESSDFGKDFIESFETFNNLYILGRITILTERVIIETSNKWARFRANKYDEYMALKNSIEAETKATINKIDDVMGKINAQTANFTIVALSNECYAMLNRFKANSMSAYNIVSKWEAATLNKLTSDISKFNGLELQLYSKLDYLTFYEKLSSSTGFYNGLLLRKKAINNQLDGAFKNMVNDYPLTQASKFNYSKLGDMNSEAALGSYFDDVIETTMRKIWESGNFEKLTTDVQVINKFKELKASGGQLSLKPKVCTDGTCSFSLPDMLIKYQDRLLNVPKTIYVDMKYYVGEEISNLVAIESKFTNTQKQVFFIDQFTQAKPYADVKAGSGGIKTYDPNNPTTIYTPNQPFRVDEIWVLTIHPQDFNLILRKVK